MRFANRKLFLPILIASLAVIIICIIVLLTQCATGLGRSANDLIRRNADGLTYGPMAAAASDEEIPDLIAVVASNGSQGYVYKDEYLFSTRANQNPDDTVINANKQIQIWAGGFADYVEKRTGVVLDMKEVVSVFMGVVMMSGAECPYDEMDEPSKDVVLNLLPEGYRTESLAIEALEAAYQTNSLVIPVYLSDGKTVVGEFLIQ
ncbi:MAG: hypothetical protein LBU61_04670 [Coriobacteriales bacterium]|jgi:hypothetical protein|nr:hypothetical protein [Coriobacteriales bacterium]